MRRISWVPRFGCGQSTIRGRGDVAPSPPLRGSGISTGSWADGEKGGFVA